MNTQNRNHRKLEIETLEGRSLPSSFSLSSTVMAYQPQTNALKSTLQVQDLSGKVTCRVIVDTSSWYEGLRPNHSETLVREARGRERAEAIKRRSCLRGSVRAAGRRGRRIPRS